MNFIFRGVSCYLYKELNGRLAPKKSNQFKHVFKLDEVLTMADGAIMGYSTENAVIRHQLNQEGFHTSGISTTPFFERARFYATVNGKYPSGYIYKINRSLLADNGIIEFNVSDYTDAPSVPEDKEIILVSKDFGMLPDAIIDQIIAVSHY